MADRIVQIEAVAPDISVTPVPQAFDAHLEQYGHTETGARVLDEVVNELGAADQARIDMARTAVSAFSLQYIAPGPATQEAFRFGATLAARRRAGGSW
jgi:hypothetical protein